MCEIENHLELEKFIKSEKIYRLFIKFPSDKVLEIENKIKYTESLPYKGIKPWLKSILDYPETFYNKKFLYCMGWEDHEIEKFISDKQKINGLKLAELKKNDPEKCNYG